MNIFEILNITKGTLVNKFNLNKKINNFKINSSEIKKDDCFITINSGYKYINDAVKNRCALIITNKKIICKPPCIIVKNTEKALGQIAKYIKEKYNPKLIAITGSTGKTTTREIIYNILKRKYNVLQNEKNYNNQIGVPLTLLNINKKTDIAIIEMGMNHLGEIKYLSNLTKPDIAAITNIGSSHIGNLGSKENILKAKLEIKEGLKGKLFVNGDDKLLKNLKNTNKSGFDIDNNLKAYNLKSNLNNSSFNIKVNNKEYLIKTNLAKHLVPDVLIAINIALYFKIDINVIIETLNKYKPYNMRMNIIKKNTNIIINDCYNSSFESLKGALDTIKNEKLNKILILGDINELGKYSLKIHKMIIPLLDQIKNKTVFLIGKNMMQINYKDSIHFNNYKELINYLKNKKIENSIILIKASRAMHFENITNFLLEL